MISGRGSPTASGAGELLPRFNRAAPSMPRSVSLLAPGSVVVAEPLVPFWATSAAVGMAGNFMGGPLAGDAPRHCSRLGTVAATDPEKIHRAWRELEERIKGRETANPARSRLRCARHRARYPLCKQ
jgi:hypothetical protein